MTHLAVFVIAVVLTRPTPQIEREVAEILWPTAALKNSVTFTVKPSAPSSNTTAKTRAHAAALRQHPKDLSSPLKDVPEPSSFDGASSEGSEIGSATDFGTDREAGTQQSTGTRIFEGQMTHPQKISGPDPVYTAKAQEDRIQGTMLVTCIVTIAGEVHNCRVAKGLQFLEASAIYALERRKYTPATLDGNPVEVAYTFRIPFVLPD